MKNSPSNIPQVYTDDTDWCKAANIYVFLYMNFNDDNMFRAMNAVERFETAEQIEDAIVNSMIKNHIGVEDTIEYLKDEACFDAIKPYVFKASESEV